MPIAPQPQLKAGIFGRSPTPRSPKPTATGAPPPKPPGGVKIEHRVGIQAPPEVVWEVIRDLESWELWNPLYTKADGEIRIGAKLNVTLALPGQPPQQITPTVLDWVPDEQLHWRLTMLGGLIRNTRYLEIEKLADVSCIVSNGEFIGGLMGPSLAKRMGRTIYRALVEMSEALKVRAEALHRRNG